jgi:hypothetical protein
LKQSTDNFLTRSLRDESRPREPACRSSCIDLVDESLVERNVDPHRPASIGKKRNSEQDGSCFDGCLHVLITQDYIHNARFRQSPACAFKHFRMLTQGDGCVSNSLFQGFAGREAPFDVRKPDAKSAVSFFFHNCHVMCRHCFETSLHLRSRTPTGKLVDPTYKPRGQIPPRMRHGDDRAALRMLERVVIAVHPIKCPSVLLQHPDQLAAVSFHNPPQKPRRDHSKRP